MHLPCVCLYSVHVLVVLFMLHHVVPGVPTCMSCLQPVQIAQGPFIQTLSKLIHDQQKVLRRVVFILTLQTLKYFSLDFIPWVFNQTFISFNYYSFLRCEAILGEFLRGIKKEPENVKFAHMVNILVLHSQPEGRVK